MYADKGLPEPARQALEAAIAIFRQLGAQKEVALALTTSAQLSA
jgi:hypothetical protein